MTQARLDEGVQIPYRIGRSFALNFLPHAGSAQRNMDPVMTYLSVIDAQDELFTSLHTRYLAIAEERKKAAVAAQAAATAAPQGTTPGAGPVSLMALLEKQNESSATMRRVCLEDSADPVWKLFRPPPAIPTRVTWPDRSACSKWGSSQRACSKSGRVAREKRTLRGCPTHPWIHVPGITASC